jgi:hypothetical protein
VSAFKNALDDVMSAAAAAMSMLEGGAAAEAAALDALDSYMNLSLSLVREADALGPRSLRRAHLALQRRRASAFHKRMRVQALPALSRWHVPTQQRLYAHLREAWPSRTPRTMVDLGCHAGHGRHLNVSDALLWLDAFGGDGGLVYGVDAIEDFAHDLLHRLHHVAPYSRMAAVEKRAEVWALARVDGRTTNLFGALRKIVNCCADKCLMPARYCCGRRSLSLERRGSDHVCMITRMHLGLLAPDERTRFPSIFPANMTASAWNSSWRGEYLVPTARMDTLWRTRLASRHIDVLKIDVRPTTAHTVHALATPLIRARSSLTALHCCVAQVDKSWRHIGLEALLEQRAVSVLAHTAHTVPALTTPFVQGSHSIAQYSTVSAV